MLPKLIDQNLKSNQYGTFKPGLAAAYVTETNLKPFLYCNLVIRFTAVMIYVQL
jgi:hypothetical protein